jgi:hypothetical protein
MRDDSLNGKFDVLYIGVLALLDRTQDTVLISSIFSAEMAYPLLDVFIDVLLRSSRFYGCKISVWPAFLDTLSLNKQKPEPLIIYSIFFEILSL